MTSLTSEFPHLVDKLTDAAPAGLSHLRDSAEPVVDRFNEALGRSSRPTWPWILLGVVGAVAVIAIVARSRRGDDAAEEDSPVRLAS